MALSSGTKLGPYEIVAPLGAGGMGEVYRARETRLDRTVAVKILPSHLSSNLEAKHRFEREARAISSESSEHLHIARRRPPRRNGFLGYGIPGGWHLGRSPHSRTITVGTSIEIWDRDLRGTGKSPQEWCDPPRPEAGQHHAHQI